MKKVVLADILFYSSKIEGFEDLWLCLSKNAEKSIDLY